MDALERAFREERAQVVASLARRLGDLQLAEDAVSEAFAAAAATWPSGGVPERPGAWLTTTAWRKALDVVRRERTVLVEPAETAGPPAPEPGLHDEDDVLQLLMTCCHPALAMEARVALTLRHVAGLTVRETAAAFLVSEETMAKRLVRARAKVKQARISFELPDPSAVPERLAGVHAVLYLVFTEGHHASGDGVPVRSDLCDEAVWLARQLHRLVPGDAETAGLLALFLLQRARLPARQDGAGRLVPLPEQDRTRWRHGDIAEARTLLASTGRGPVGRYQVEAAIAALHATAATPDATSWHRVADLYRLLDRLAPSPVVTLNRAVAVARADGADAALLLLTPVLEDPRLASYAPLHAAHADVLERLGRNGEAAAAWERAAALTGNAAQRDELRRRAAEAARTEAAPSTPSMSRTAGQLLPGGESVHRTREEEESR